MRESEQGRASGWQLGVTIRAESEHGLSTDKMEQWRPEMCSLLRSHCKRVCQPCIEAEARNFRLHVAEAPQPQLQRHRLHPPLLLYQIVLSCWAPFCGERQAETISGGRTKSRPQSEIAMLGHASAPVCVCVCKPDSDSSIQEQWLGPRPVDTDVRSAAPSCACALCAPLFRVRWTPHARGPLSPPACGLAICIARQARRRRRRRRYRRACPSTSSMDTTN